MENQHLCQQSHFYVGFMGNCLEQNLRNDIVIISHFHENS